MADLDRCPTCGWAKGRIESCRCPDAWHLRAEIPPMPVRLLVTMPWGGGYQINPAPPIQDVPVGGEYVVECAAQVPIEVHRVLVRDFALVQVAAGNHISRAEVTSISGADREYRLDPPLVAQTGVYVLARLSNDTDVPQTPRSATIARDVSILDPYSPQSASMRQEALHPARVELPPAALDDWVLEDIQVENRCGFCGRVFDAGSGHTCAEAAISPGGSTFLTVVGDPAPVPDPGRHAPRIARTLYEGPGNATLVNGCTCGAEVTSAEAYAAHIGWPDDAVRVLLDLYGVADDLIEHPGRAVDRADAARQLWRCLEVRRPAPYEIRGDEVVGPDLRITLDHVIELLHMRCTDDPRGLPTASMMEAISELVVLLNSAYTQGRRSTAR